MALAARAGAWLARPMPFDRGAVLAAPAAGLADTTPRRERVITLGRAALAECVRGATMSAAPLVIALPDAEPGEEALEPRELAQEIAAQVGGAIDRGRITPVVAGRLGGVMALARASELLEREDGPELVVVGGVDSLVGPAVIARLVQENSVVPAGWTQEEAGKSAVPGEAAAFLLLSRPKGADASALGQLLDARVIDRPDEDEGEALSAAISTGGQGAERVACVCDSLSDVDADELWADATRAAGRPGTEVALPETASAFGEVGAASATLTLALQAWLDLTGANAASRTLLVVGCAQPRFGLVVFEPLARTSPPVSAVVHRRSLAHRVATLIDASLTELTPAISVVALRLSPGRAKPLHAAVAELKGVALALQDAEPDDRFMTLVDRCSAALDHCRGLASSAHEQLSRRRRGGAPALHELSRVCGTASSELARARPTLLSLVAGHTPVTTGATPLRVADGSASLLWLPHAIQAIGQPAPAAASVDDLDEEQEAAEGEASAHEIPENTAAPAAERVLELGLAVDAALSEIASAFSVRRPGQEACWSPALAAVDDAILRQLDWLHSILERRDDADDGARASVVSALRAADSPLDPARAFATTLVLACAADSRLSRAATRKALLAPPELTHAYAEALALGSSPELGRSLVELCLPGDVGGATVALTAMRRRRQVSVPLAAIMLHAANVNLRALAADALGFASHREPAITALEGRLSLESSDEVVAALVLALARLGAPHTDVHLARAFADVAARGGEQAMAARCQLARVAAARARAPEALAWSGLAKSPQELEVLGWFGRAVAVPTLIAALERQEQEPALCKAAARALVRILGVTPSDSGRGQVLNHTRMHAIDDEHLCVAAPPYRQYWSDHQGAFGNNSKYRFGEVWSSQHSLRELSARAHPRDRFLAELELATSSGPAWSSLDLEDWARRQLAALPAEARVS